MKLDDAVLHYLNRQVPLNLIALIVPKSYENKEQHYFNVTETYKDENDEDQSRKIEMEFQKTKHGNIRVIRNNAVLNPIVVETATQLFIDLDGKLHYK